MTTGVLLSGGVDSIALSYWKKPQYAFTVDYGQVPAPGEIRAARQICELLGVQHIVVRNDCSSLGSGDLAGTPPSALAPASDWWPYRNQLLLTLVATKALSLGVSELMIGTVRSDACHSDGSAAFIDAIDKLLSIQEGHIRVTAPAIGMTTVELIRVSETPAEVLAWSHSCHAAEFACGSCRGCNKHREVMYELGREIY